MTRLEGLESRTEFNCSRDFLCILDLGGGDGDCEGEEIVFMIGDQSEPEVRPRLTEDSVGSGANNEIILSSGLDIAAI